MPINFRRCISCRQVAPKTALIRIVRLYPTRQVQLDQGMGRSAYLCPNASCLEKARQKNRLGRALKAPIPDDLYQVLQARLPSATN